jgi:ribosomal protein L37AE/L43A
MKDGIACPLCESLIQYNHKLDFWECQNCGTEVWPGMRETKKNWCNKSTLVANGKLGVKQIEKVYKISERKGG